jgi:hypothetical protein
MSAVSSAPLALHELLASVSGKDITKMPADIKASFLQSASTRFQAACLDLHKVILDDNDPDRGWLWQCEPAASFDSEWVASYSLVKVDHAAALAGASMNVQVAAAMNPGMKFSVDFFAHFNEAGASSGARPAKLKVSVAVSGDPELMIAEAYLQAASEDFPLNLTGIDVLVVSGVDGGDEFKNPASVHQAFNQAAESVRLAGEEQSSEASITDTVYLELEIGDTASKQDLHRSLSAMGQFFVGASNALQYV